MGSMKDPKSSERWMWGRSGLAGIEERRGAPRPVPRVMKPEFEHDAVEALADFADHWSRAPLPEEVPAILAAMDQFAAGTLENMNKAEMTEPERVAFALGFMLCASGLHDQLEHLGLHEAPIDRICEAQGLFAGTVAAEALRPD